MVTIDDFVQIPVTDEMLRTAEYLSNWRLLFEYPRRGYGVYGPEHLPNLVNGYLGEFAFFQFLHNHLQEKVQELSAKERYETVKGRLEYKLVIGTTQSDYDFRVGAKTVEVKTYGTRVLHSVDECLKYNLFVDLDQSSNADIYVQTFIVDEGKGKIVILAGFHEGKPQNINRNIPNPAHSCPVPQLQPIVKLLDWV